MNTSALHRLLEFLAGIEPMMAVLWSGLAFFTVALAVLMYTRWGQYKPLRKCMALSLFAHLLMAGYATTVEIVTPLPRTVEQIVHVTLGDGPDQDAPPGGAGSETSKTTDQPWEAFAADVATKPDEPALQRGKTDPLAEPKRVLRGEAKLPGAPPVEHVALAEVKTVSPRAESLTEAAKKVAPVALSERIEPPAPQRRDAAPAPTPGAAAPSNRLADAAPPPARTTSDDIPAALLQQIVPLPQNTDIDPGETPGAVLERPIPLRVKPADGSAKKPAPDAAYATGGEASRGGTDGNPPADESGRFSVPSVAGLTDKAAERQRSTALVASSAPLLSPSRAARVNDGEQPVPDAYRLRVAPNRSKVAQSRGGTAETEAAVKAALKWLADNQAADGRWDARAHGAGKETNVLGRDRQGAGGRADTAMTGLALLAFLGSGHTHLDGPYREEVRRGLEYLIRAQAADGSLGGQGASFEYMYCHAMATCAMSEAYGMTRDPRLRGPAQRAIEYTIASQDPRGGGWRYRPGDPGDTSQLGWQLMSLKSAELAGIAVPERTRQGVIRFLQSVASGQYGGRASYRPGERPTRPMTAEALVCWQFVGLAREHPACGEAGDYIVGEVPGQGEYNLYYWYYATLSMCQLQGPHWQRWNDALRTVLVARQVKDGPQSGSWDTSDLWGGHGGRVYTTALAALTLEVYYRFLPIYGGGASEDR